MNELEEIDEAFDYWWRRLGRKMPRKTPKESAEKYRRRTARAAFLIAAACLIKPEAGN